MAEMINCAPSGLLLMARPTWARGIQTCDHMWAQKQAQQTLLALARSVKFPHLGRMGGYLVRVPPGGDVVLGRLDFGGGTGVGAEPRSADGLTVGGSSTTHKWESIASRSASIQSMYELTTSGLPERK